jgi:hypothetical protein
LRIGHTQRPDGRSRRGTSAPNPHAKCGCAVDRSRWAPGRSSGCRPSLARRQRRQTPTPQHDRVARIREKLAESKACLVIGHFDADRDVWNSLIDAWVQILQAYAQFLLDTLMSGQQPAPVRPGRSVLRQRPPWVSRMTRRQTWRSMSLARTTTWNLSATSTASGKASRTALAGGSLEDHALTYAPEWNQMFAGAPERRSSSRAHSTSSCRAIIDRRESSSRRSARSSGRSPIASSM